jgi:hypothetical protein
MGQPGMPGSQFPGEDAMIRRIKDLERQMQQFSAANVLATAGIQAVPDGIVVNGSETVNGPLTINGAATITGTLSLPAGIIGNDALSDPVSPLATHVGTNNFGLATGPNVEQLRATIPVPAGYTQALVFATATMHVWNNNGTQDDAYLAARINGTGIGASSQVTAGPTSGVCLPATGTTLLTSLGSTFYVAALCSSASNAWAVNTNNFINLDVMTIFLR